MQNTLNKIKSIYPLSEAHTALLLEQLQPVQFPKNHLIIDAGKTGRSLYFLEKGVARAFLDGKDNQITFWFGMEGDLLLSFNSYIHQKPGYEHIELLEDCFLYEIKTEALEQLYLEHTALANWGRKFAELELVKTEERYIARLFKSARIRYAELQETYPGLLNRIALGHIASFLGVTQVTLSRIRSEIRQQE